METKERIVELLTSTNRSCIEKLITYLEIEGFFESPTSTRFHGSYTGGLAKHSLRVYELLCGWIAPLKLDMVSSSGQKPLPLEPNNIIIVALLHDVCKIGAYVGSEKPYKWNKGQPKGHALLSIERIKKHIELINIEELMIKYHMGVYGLNEFYSEDDWQSGEYPLRGDHSNDKGMTRDEIKAARYGKSMANAWFHNPICKMMYFCDEIATLEAKASEV